MKSSPHLVAILLGGLVGVLLCFVFYRVTGISMTLLSSASLVRQIADLICITAFATFGTTMALRLFAISTSRSQRAKSERHTNI